MIVYSLSFTFNPSSRVYGYDEVELCTNGSQIDVTLDNVEQYIEATVDFCLHTGIQRQINAFTGENRDGGKQR